MQHWENAQVRRVIHEGCVHNMHVVEFSMEVQCNARCLCVSQSALQVVRCVSGGTCVWGVKQTCTFTKASVISPVRWDLSLMCSFCNASPKVRETPNFYWDVKQTTTIPNISIEVSAYLLLPVSICLITSLLTVHCEVGEWTDWGPCVRRRSMRTYRRGEEMRTRKVLRSPSVYGDPCPHVSEIKKCVTKKKSKSPSRL